MVDRDLRHTAEPLRAALASLRRPLAEGYENREMYRRLLGVARTDQHLASEPQAKRGWAAPRYCLAAQLAALALKCGRRRLASRGSGALGNRTAVPPAVDGDDPLQVLQTHIQVRSRTALPVQKDSDG